MNHNLEFENEDPCPNSIEDNHPRTNYGAGYDDKEIDSDLWYEIYTQHPITWETPAVKQVIQYIQKNYALTKK
jgi:hypothetical protein